MARLRRCAAQGRARPIRRPRRSRRGSPKGYAVRRRSRAECRWRRVRARNRDAANSGMLWRASKVIPAAVEIGFEPGVIVHRRWVGWNANVAEKAVGVARRNIHAAAEGDGEMGEVPADADAFVISLKSGAGRSRILIAESQMAADEIADRLGRGSSRAASRQIIARRCRRACRFRNSGCRADRPASRSAETPAELPAHAASKNPAGRCPR